MRELYESHCDACCVHLTGENWGGVDDEGREFCKTDWATMESNAIAAVAGLGLPVHKALGENG